MKALLRETGYSLIEVLVSLTIISLVFILFNSYFVNSLQHNKTMDKMFSSNQLCQSLLDVYKSKSFNELSAEIGHTKTIYIKEELQLDASADIPYSAEVTINEHPDFADQVLMIKISVYSQDGRNKAELEGYKRK